MTYRYDVPERTWLVPFVLCAATLLPAPAWAQEAPAPQRVIKQEIKAVVRISKQLIDDVVTRREVTAAIPYYAEVLGFDCRGVITGRGRLSVEMMTNRGDGAFVISSQGTAETHARGVRGPIVAMGPAWGPFASQTLVRFDGRKFKKVRTVPCAQVHGKLDGLEGRHGTRVSRAVGSLLVPMGQLQIPRAEREATPIGEFYLTNFVNGLADEIVGRLNRTTRLEVSLNRLFPETRGWEFQLSTDPGFLQAAYGPAGSEAPVLPENPGRLENYRLEIWLRATTKNAEALEELSKRPLARPLIQRYLEATLPELAALTEERSVTAVGQWLVICIGPPKSE
jgi:hypothetical protein